MNQLIYELELVLLESIRAGPEYRKDDSWVWVFYPGGSEGHTRLCLKVGIDLRTIKLISIIGRWEPYRDDVEQLLETISRQPAEGK